jgi:hypothetical protein
VYWIQRNDLRFRREINVDFPFRRRLIASVITSVTAEKLPPPDWQSESSKIFLKGKFDSYMES